MRLRMHDADVNLIRGEPKHWSRSADSGGLVICCFSGTCGARLWHEPAGSGFLHIKPGTLDEPLQVAPRFEAWTKRKAPRLRINGLEASFERESASIGADEAAGLKAARALFKLSQYRITSARKVSNPGCYPDALNDTNILELCVYTNAARRQAVLVVRLDNPG